MTFLCRLSNLELIYHAQKAYQLQKCCRCGYKYRCINFCNQPKFTYSTVIFQLQVVIGSDNYFLTAEQQGNVHDCIAMLLDMGALLHLEEYNAQAISQLDANCLRLLSNCKTTFAGFSKSNFKFKKFHHACWHMGWSITRFGALWVTCAGRWEHFHQTLKFQYKVSVRIRSVLR